MAVHVRVQQDQGKTKLLYYHFLLFFICKDSPNLLKPGKRPRSSMTPAIIVNKSSGKVKLVTGAAGGSKITTAIAQVKANTK